MKKLKTILLLCCVFAMMLGVSGGVLAMGAEENCEYSNITLFAEEENNSLSYTCNNPIWNEELKKHEYLTYSVPSMPYSVGIDVSKWQKNIDWQAVKNSGIDFAIIRVGGRGSDTGVIELDPYFHQNIQGAKAAGLRVGVYIFSQAVNIDEAREEAAFAMHHLNGYTLDLPVVIDYEFRSNGRLNQAYDTKDPDKKLNASKATDILLAFCDMVEQYGYDSMVYANQNMLTVYLDGERLSRETEVWLARYNTSNAYPYAYSFWQFTSKGYVDGVEGTSVVDLNFRFVDKVYRGGGTYFFPFVDAESDDWYYDAVKYTYDNNVFNGTEWNEFAPYEPMTRAMMVSVLYRMDGSSAVKGDSKFNDLTSDWYKKAVIWGEQNGVVSGTSATTFEPDVALTREEMVTFMQRYAKYKGQDIAATGSLSGYPDGGNTSSWAQEAMKWAVGKTYVKGFEDGTLRPTVGTNRAEVATVLMNFDIN
ncbi:MAG: S-layer homology domain-containing protein [Firmicutes bacterium]|nr:S-layer homology domain-containing protein [Bacillota bacterium]